MQRFTSRRPYHRFSKRILLILALILLVVTSTGPVRAQENEAQEKTPVQGYGWFAACQDTEGNAFSLWQSDQSAG